MNSKIAVWLAIGAVAILGSIAIAQFKIFSVLKGLNLSPKIENHVGANSYSNPSIAQIGFTESSTTLASLCNNDGSDRWINGPLFAFFNPDDPAGNGVATGTYTGSFVFDIVTSTSQFASSTTGVFLIRNQALTTSTASQLFTTSTYTQLVSRQWKNGECVNLQTNKATSSTGFLAIPYYNK